MERSLRPERFDANPDASDAKRKWQHWYKTFSNYVENIEGITDENKLKVLINHLDSAVFEYISDIETYDAALTTLRNVYVKPTNEVFARYRLATCKQRLGQSLEEFMQCLKRLSSECNFAAVTAALHREGAIRDAFIAGITSPSVRQRLLESDNLTLQHVFDKARSLEEAQRNAEQITGTYPSFTSVSSNAAAINATGSETKEQCLTIDEENVAAVREKCYFCGNNKHARKLCPARDAVCYKCQKRGHFAKICRSKRRSIDEISAALFGMSIAKKSSNKTSFPVKINGIPAHALFDTGSTNSHVSENVANRLNLEIFPEEKSVGLAIKGHTSNSIGKCEAEIELKDRKYANVCLSVLQGLLTDVVLGQDFMQQHEGINIHFGGDKPILELGALKPLKAISPPSLFEHLAADCHPVTTKSRRYSKSDNDFIAIETRRLLAEGIIEPSISPWRAQVVVATNANHKKRLCIDYSQTINKYTQLDGYPLPRMQDVVNKVAQYNIYSTLDLKSAYHQITLPVADRKYTAFEANGQLFQFTRMPFGLKKCSAMLSAYHKRNHRKERLRRNICLFGQCHSGG